MRAGEEYSELVDFGGTYGGGGGGGGGTGGGGGGGGSGSGGGNRYGNAPWSSRTPGRNSNRMPAEAEDALGPNNSPRPHSRSRSGLYYSPPGTSYTIVERPSSGMHHHSSRDYRDYYNTTSPRGSFRVLIVVIKSF